MQKNKITAGPPITVGEVTVIPVIKASIRCHEMGKGTSLSGFKQPTAVVVISPSGTHAFDVTGKETSLDELMEAAPEPRGMM